MKRCLHQAFRLFLLVAMLSTLPMGSVSAHITNTKTSAGPTAIALSNISPEPAQPPQPGNLPPIVPTPSATPPQPRTSNLPDLTKDPTRWADQQAYDRTHVADEPGAGIQGAIHGHVYAPEGKPQAGVLVKVTLPGGAAGPVSKTDPQGQFVFNALPSGMVHLNFSDAQGKPLAVKNADDAWVMVGQDQTSGGRQSADDLQFWLAPALPADISRPQLDDGTGEIHGTVTSATTGDPIEGMGVILIDPSYELYQWITTTYTDSQGNYAFAGLGAGSYVIRYQPYGADIPVAIRDYLPEYYNEKQNQTDADRVSVQDGQIVNNINASLETGGEITGQVVSYPEGTPLQGVSVNAYSSTNTPQSTAYTDAAGNFTIYGLATGSYILDINPANCSYPCTAADYAEQYYNGKKDSATADPIAVVSGQVTDSIQVALRRGGTISGQVTNAQTGQPLNNINVFAYDPTRPAYSSANISDADGNFTLRGLPDGSYRVTFTDYAYVYVTQYYDHTSILDQYTPVVITDGQVVTGINAALSQGGTISGTVTDPTGSQPLSNISVTAYDASNVSGFGTITGADGKYQITGLAAGQYRVFFSDYNGTGYLNEYYNNKRDLAGSDWVTVTAGATTSGIDAVMDMGGILTGVITAEDTGKPLANVEVTVYRGEDPTYYYINNAITDPSGKYTIKGLPQENYRLYINPNSCWTMPCAVTPYVAEYYNDKPYLETSDNIPVAENQTVTVDAALARATQITGVVKTAVGGLPVSNTYITAYTGSYQSMVASTWTDSLGNYTLNIPSGGDYILSAQPPTDCFFDPCPPLGLVRQFYNGKYSADQADLVHVADHAAAAGIDFSLPEGGKISGHVVSAKDNQPLSNVHVGATGKNNGNYIMATTDSNGDYSLVSLPGDAYVVLFSPDQNYVFQYYNDKPSYEAADLVNVSLGSEATGINAALHVGGRVSGLVTAEDTGLGLESVRVDARNDNGDTFASAFTDPQGHYQINGLQSGSYRICFYTHDYDSSQAVQDYISECYDNKASTALATPVAVTEDNTTTGINAALSLGGKITGHVTAADTHQPLQSVAVELYDTNWSFENETSTGADGTYTLTGLAEGKYYLRFLPQMIAGQKYASEYYKEKSYRGAADVLSVTRGSILSGIDADLDLGGSITGKVTASDTGEPLLNVYINIYRVAPDGYISFETGNWTNNDGIYRVDGLAAGDYRVEFSPSAGVDYVRESYDNQPYIDTASTLHVTAGNVVSGINAALDPGVHIHGRVTSEVDGSGLDGIYVQLLDATGRERGYGWTDSDGNFVSQAVLPGSYRVHTDRYNWASYWTRSHLSEYYNDKSSYDQADLVNLSLGSPQEINFVLAMGGKLSGKITAQDTGVGLQGVDVYAYTSGANNYNYHTVSLADGSYELIGLPAGDYQVNFQTMFTQSMPAGNYTGEYYDGVHQIAKAKPVQVTQGKVTGNINASLEPGGRISGMVTSDDAHAPLPDVHVFVFDSQSGDQVGYAFSSVAGSYTTGAILPGQYRVEFEPDNAGRSAAYVWEIYNNRHAMEAADLVTVSLDQPNKADISLELGGRVSGQVRAADTGKALANVQVAILPANYPIAWEDQRWTGTASDGTYSFKGLRSQSYRIQFLGPGKDQYADEWYNNRHTQSTASLITVTTGASIMGINAALDVGGRITGKITDSATGLPVSNAYVSVSGSQTDSYRGVNTAPDGTYQIGGLPADDYYMWISAGDYVSERYDDAHMGYQNAKAIPVALGATISNINAGLEKGGWISGRVTAAGSGIYAIVSALNATGEVVDATSTAEDGSYRLALLPGSYRLFFHDFRDGSYAAQYYPGASSFTDAQAVNVTLGQTNADINADVQPSGQITGRVTGSAGQPLADIYVDAFNAHGDRLAGGRTIPDGSYIIGSLPAGNYRLHFQPDSSGSASAYLPEYYNNQTNLASANPVNVTAGSVTIDINADLQAVAASFDQAAGSLKEDAGDVSLTLALSQASQNTVSVPYRVSGGATGGQDHTLIDGQFVFEPGQTSQSIAFHIIDDAVSESDESIVVTLQAPDGAVLGQNGVQTITILDNDPKPQDLPAPSLTGIQPAQGREGLTGEVIVSGANFTAGSAASLSMGGQSIDLATTPVDASHISAVVPSDLQPGLYALSVKNPDGKQASLENAYRVLPAASDDLTASSFDLWTDPAALTAGQAVNLGLVVQRQGGASTLSDLAVRFYLGNPAAGGALIGTGLVASMPPHGSASTAPLAWKAPAAGTYTIYAVIDPDQAVTETVESNNTIQRAVTVSAAPAEEVDQTAPVVSSFKINGGAASAASAQVKLSVQATDAQPGTGVSQVIFYEYSFNESTQHWIQTQASDWLPYSGSNAYTWNLTPTAGAKYIQAWAADGAGNISAQPISSYINYMPASDTLARGQSRYYVFNLSSGDGFAASVTSLGGDADLYVWAPDFQFRDPWSSIASSGVDQVQFSAPVTGVYVLQVYGYSGTSYQLSAGKGMTLPLSAEKDGHIQSEMLETANKLPLDEPELEPGTEPSQQHAITELGTTPKDEKFYVFLPQVRR